MGISLPLILICLNVGLQEPPESVRLDLPDPVELKLVVEYIATTLQINVISDDDAVAGKKVSLRTGKPVQRDELLELLRTLLRSRSLVLLAGDEPNWYRVIPLEKLGAETLPIRQSIPVELSDSDVVTYQMSLNFVDANRVQAAIAPYITKPGGTVIVLAERKAVLVTDFVRNVRRMIEIAALMDVDETRAAIELVSVRHHEPADLASLIQRVLGIGTRAPPGSPQTPFDASVQPDPNRNGLLVIGSPALIQHVRRLVEQFDTPVSRRAEVYRPRFVTVARMRGLIEQFDPSLARRLIVDEASNMVFATLPDADHARIRELLSRFDSPSVTSSTPLRSYKLLNRRAADVFATLAGLLGTATDSQAALANDTMSERQPVDDRAIAPTSAPAGAPGVASSGLSRPGESSFDGSSRVASIAFRTAQLSLSVDEHTNTIIALTSPEIHQQIDQLVQQLDRRRPQVLVEVTLVSINIDDSLNLGVELEQLDLGSPWDYLLFTSFGLSTINPSDGTRRLIPAAGGSGALIAPHEVPIIIQALATNGSTRIYSAPRILVDDNAMGKIESVAESPFTSVNASNTVATTSFAGFAKAGTQLQIEPHIAEGDHLEIKYDLTVSSFTGAGSGGAPPPRSSDTISSTIRVPDGYTVVVGGLQTETSAESTSQVPLIGDVPGLGVLFGNRSQSKSRVRLYAFIRPTVLRQEQFEDLKYLSGSELRAAEVPDGFPPDRLAVIR